MKIRDSKINQLHIIKDPIALTLILSLISVGVLLFTNIVIFNDNVTEYIEKAFQLLLACTLGSLIGLEREYKQRPAGVRTFALVCIGSTLIMVVSFDIFEKYHEFGNFDPTRLGAQVVSGIGFLGAGTIIHNKASIKGLTSAAGLWVVASIGLAIGAKMYVESVGYFLVVFFILHYINSMERRQLLKHKLMSFEIISKDITGVVGEVGKIFADEKLKILSIDIERDDDVIDDEDDIPESKGDNNENDRDVKIIITAQIQYGYDINTIKKSIKAVEGVVYISIKKLSNSR